jgi:hypothetical protein
MENHFLIRKKDPINDSNTMTFNVNKDAKLK